MDNNNDKRTKPSPSSSQSRRKRARKPDGKFQGDNPTTPELNEAWEPTDVSEVVTPKEVKYEVKPKVGGTSKSTAGKYGKKPKVTPTFGKVTSTYH